MGIKQEDLQALILLIESAYQQHMTGEHTLSKGWMQMAYITLKKYDGRRILNYPLRSPDQAKSHPAKDLIQSIRSPVDEN